MYRLNASTKKCSLDAINELRCDNQLVLYTSSYGSKTGTNGLGLEVVIEDGVVVSKGSNDNVIPAEGMVLSGAGLAKDWINECVPVGTKVVYHESDMSIELL
ncbi:MAG: hypothetical protein ACRDDX_14485 [Cellulosilyticaceae bacterium]